MAKNVLVGVNNIAKKPSNIYVGVDNKARKVKAVYIGVNGIARQCWPAGILPNSYTQFEYIDGSCGRINADLDPLTYPRIVVDFSMITIDSRKVGEIIGGYYYNNEYNYDTHQGWENSWIITYCASFGLTASKINAFEFIYTGDQLDETGYYGDDQYYTLFTSNTSEGILLNSKYTLDFFNNNGVYLYNLEGYYSIASHNYINSITQKASISNRKTNPTTNDDYNYIKLFGPGMIVYGCKIYQGNTLVRDYYPCYRNSDKYMGYYDLVNRVFYVARPGIQYHDDHITYDEAIEREFKIGPLV